MTYKKQRLLAGTGLSTAVEVVPRSPIQASIEVNLAGSPLGAGQRGLVVSSPLRIIDGGSFEAGHPGLDPDELRFQLLFWDQLDWPGNTVFHVEADAHARFLEEEGVLVRSAARFSGSGFGGELIQGMHVGTYVAREEREPGRWSLARGERSISFPNERLETGRGTLFSLHKAIPVPERSVHFADILEFKRRRSSELLAIRHHLEDIYQRIAGATDRPLAEMVEFERLDAALADGLAASRETGWPLRFTGFEAKLNTASIGAGAAAFLASSNNGVPLPKAIAAGLGAFAFAAIGTGVRLRGASVSATPFEYVSHANDEL